MEPRKRAQVLAIERSIHTKELHMGSIVLERPAARAASTTERYAKCIETSKRIRWDIDRDVIRGREFDFSKKFMPDGLSKVEGARLPGGIRRPGSSRRSRAARTPTCSRSSSATSAPRRSSVASSHALGDQVALEALVRFTDEELKHQELFRRLEGMAASGHAGRATCSCRSRTRSPTRCSASAPGRCSR